MENVMSVDELQGLADLVRHRPGHLHRERLVFLLHEVLLEIAAGHVLHDDAVLSLPCEFLFETHNVFRVTTTRLYINLVLNAFLELGLVHRA